ncbi:hypothetical protein MRX96_045785 [Rhipicephalus microplus]
MSDVSDFGLLSAKLLLSLSPGRNPMADATIRSVEANALVASKAVPAKPASPASSDFRFCSSSSFTPSCFLN